MSNNNANQSEENLIDLSGLTEEERTEIASMIQNQFGDNWQTMFSEDVQSEEFTIPPETAEKIKQRFSASLKRGNLGAEALKLGTSGFIEFLKAIMRPVFNSKQSK